MVRNNGQTNDDTGLGNYSSKNRLLFIAIIVATAVASTTAFLILGGLDFIDGNFSEATVGGTKADDEPFLQNPVPRPLEIERSIITREGETLTGNLTVYVIPVNANILSPSGINIVSEYVQDIVAGQYTNLGASPSGQYSYTEMVKSANTVSFYIDPDVKKPDGTSVTLDDIMKEYSFGNGISCCGIELKDEETRVKAAVFVVDQAYDAKVQAKLEEIKARLQ